MPLLLCVGVGPPGTARKGDPEQGSCCLHLSYLATNCLPVLSLELVDTPRPMSDKAFCGACLFFFFFFFEIQVAIKHIRSFTSRSLAAPQGTFLFSDSMAALDKQPQSIRQGEKQVGAHTRKLLRFLNSSCRG